MLYISLKSIAEKFPNKLAVNNMTYSELLTAALGRPYSKVCYATGVDVLLDLIKAASVNKPIIVMPKENRESVVMPDNLTETFALVLYSSGSTGARKPIVLPESMLLANAKNVIDCNGMTSDSRVLTVCSLNHTAGITCQTLAGLLCGAYVLVEGFNPFNCLRLLEENGITHTHMIPMMTEILMKSHDKPILPKLKFVWTGSDVITKQQVDFWLNHDRQFMITYGMTEAGPPVLQHTFNNGDDISIFDKGLVVGSQPMCEVKITDGELCLRGAIVNREGWLETGDCFKYEDGWFFYTGRKAAGGKIVPKGSTHFN
jgi:acyl-coenzyme A synthetase/AMP-(fatty) acid ligase